MAADADAATTAIIAELLNQDAREAAWANGESPTRRGQGDDDSEDEDYRPSGMPSAKKRKPKEETKPTRPAASPKPGPKPVKNTAPPASGDAPQPPRPMAASLRDLIAHGLVRPGSGVLRTVYKGTPYDGDLGPSGVIHHKGHFFDVPSAFSLYIKRLTQPDRKADDGWKSVTYAGVTLYDLKMKLQSSAQNASGGVTATETVKPEPAAPGSKKTKTQAPPKLQAAAGERVSDGEQHLNAAESSKPASTPVVPSPEPPARVEASEYAKSRPQRERLPPQRLVPGTTGPNSDLCFVNANPYTESSRPPFRVEIHPMALVMMDAHAHMSTAEVIGFLGGSFDRTTQTLTLARALPARQLVARDAAVEVELDPEAMPAILEACEADGLSVVGWYHSHPVFATQPSVRDVTNQGAYQRLFEGTPFIGAIVGPYPAPSTALESARTDEAHAAGTGRRPDSVSEVRLFHVEQNASALGGGVPRELAWTFVCHGDTQTPPTSAHLLAGLQAAAEKCAQSLLRVDFATSWRAGDGTSRREKLRTCLSSRLEPWRPCFPNNGADKLVDACLTCIDDAWMRG